MGLSSQLAPSAIAKPGVIANAAARPASPYDGQVIYQQDTDQAYVWNGSAWVLLSTGTANPPGLELIKTQTIGTSVTSITVSDVFSSSYDNYKITAYGGSSPGASALNIQFGSTAANYYNTMFYYAFGGTTATVANVVNGSSIVYAGVTSAQSVHINLDVFGPNLAKRTAINGPYLHVSPSGEQGITAGFLNDNNQYTAFTITSAQAITGGTIRVYGYKN